MNLPRAVATSASVRCRAYLQSFAFEALFEVPPTYRFIPMCTRSRCGIIHAGDWEHERYNDSDRLIPRSECFDETDRVGEHRSGSLKYVRLGKVIQEVTRKP
jgi:hypothetical protein